MDTYIWLSFSDMVLLGLVLLIVPTAVSILGLRALRQIAQGHRLSAIFTLVGKDGEIVLDPAQFEPNRDKILEKVLLAIRTESHPDPDTWAYCVVNHSGLELFLAPEARGSLKKAFGRLRANSDEAGALVLAREVVGQL